MDNYLVALDPKDLKYFLPTVKRYEQLWQRVDEQIEAHIHAGHPRETYELDQSVQTKSEELEYRLYELGKKYGKRRDSYNEDMYSQSFPYNHVASAMEKVKPGAEKILFALTNMVVTAEEVKICHRMLEELLVSVNFDAIIKQVTHVTREPEPEFIYRIPFKKRQQMVKYCARNNYALLNTTLDY